MQIKTKFTTYELWEMTTFATLSVFFLYSLWFQQVYTSISGAFNFFGIAFIVLLILNPKKIGFYRELSCVYLFLGVILFETLFTARYKATSNQMLITVLGYVLPMFIIFLYVEDEIRKLKKILWIIWIAIVLLSFGSIMHPVVANTGAVSVGALNVNVFSSFLLLGLMSSLILYFQEYDSKWKRIFLLFGIAVNAIAQVNSASRRGFLVFAFVIGFVLWESIRIRYKNSPITKFFFVAFVVICCLVVANLFLEKYADTALVSRLLGRATDTAQGDRMRAVYQAGAFDLFVNDPIFGYGLNSVAQTVGVYSHSLYFELLGCTGAIGTITLLSFFLSNIVFCVRLMKIDRSKSGSVSEYLSMNEIAFCLAILISGYAVVLIYDMYFYIMVAIIASIRKCITAQIIDG